MADTWGLPLLSSDTVELVEYTEDAMLYVAENLKLADREEVHATLGHRRYADALRLSVQSAESARIAVSAYGEPLALLGVTTVSLLYNIGCPWLMTINATRRHRRALMTLGKTYTAAMLQKYDTLANHVDARHTKSVAWLQHLGFTIEPPKPYGALALPFHRFSIAR